MTAQYSFEVDAARDLVRIAMAGLFLPTHVEGFFEARRRAHANLTCAPGQHLTRTDISAMDGLPQETADAFAALLAHPQSRARRLAFIVAPTMLLRGHRRRHGTDDLVFCIDRAQRRYGEALEGIRLKAPVDRMAAAPSTAWSIGGRADGQGSAAIFGPGFAFREIEQL
jgi:hypothetical protein